MRKSKLNLKKVTVRDLDESKLNNIAGGTGDSCYAQSGCVFATCAGDTGCPADTCGLETTFQCTWNVNVCSA